MIIQTQAFLRYGAVLRDTYGWPYTDRYYSSQSQKSNNGWQGMNGATLPRTLIGHNSTSSSSIWVQYESQIFNCIESRRRK